MSYHPDTYYQKKSEKGVVNGYASLDGDGKALSAQVPSGVSGAVSVENETLSGAVDGVNTIFITAFAYTSRTIKVYLNGLRQGSGDYSETSSTTITFSVAPSTGDTIIVDYKRT